MLHRSCGGSVELALVLCGIAHPLQSDCVPNKLFPIFCCFSNCQRTSNLLSGSNWPTGAIEGRFFFRKFVLEDLLYIFQINLYLRLASREWTIVHGDLNE